MDCPVCKNAMITLELSDVEIDHCTDCGGIWLDAGELEILIGDERKAKQLLQSFKVDSKSREKPRRCPICLKRMRKITVGQVQKPLLIDRCTKEHGLWFDKGELSEILRSAQLDKDSKIQKLLAEMFGQQQALSNEK